MKDNKPIDVVLIYPKTGVDIGIAIAPPFSLLMAAAPLHNSGIRVRLIDQRVDQKWHIHLKEALKDRPVCCGISSMTGKQILYGIEAAKAIRKEAGSSVPIVWGGIHPTLLPEQTARSGYADVVCVGEGEQTLMDLVTSLKNNAGFKGVKGIAFLEGDKYVFTGEQPLIDIEKLFPTPWDLVDVDYYINSGGNHLKGTNRVLDIGQTSRGCPYSCTFCYSPVMHRHKWRVMSAEKTFNTIIENVKRFDLDGVWLRDDEFFLDAKRVWDVCERMVNEPRKFYWYTSGARITDILRLSGEQMGLIKRSGAHVMRFGAESGSDRVLKFLNKGQTVGQILEVNQRCKKAGIKPVYAFMCGVPTETFREINGSIDLFFRLKKENPDASLGSISQYTAYPGTPLYDMAVGMGLKPPERLEGWSDWVAIETDFDGKRMPWLNSKHRDWIGNLTYINLLLFASSNIMPVEKGKPLAGVINFVSRLCSGYFAWRLRRKLYHFAVEIRFLVSAFKLYMKVTRKDDRL